MKKVSRRKVLKAGMATASLAAIGCATKNIPEAIRKPGSYFDFETNEYDFIIVGSGAGGGPLAIRLAQAGFYVLLLEAGGEKPSGYSEVPVLHGKATDDPAINWGFFVQRYGADKNQYEKLNSKYIPKMANGYGGGVYYPRGTGLGGSTQMNALIHLYPEESDWGNIAKITGDNSWAPGEMYKLFQGMHTLTVENLGTNTWNGANDLVNQGLGLFGVKEKYQMPWLHLEQAPISLLRDRTLLRFMLGAFEKEGLLNETIDKILQGGNVELNPNRLEYIRGKRDGMFSIPFNVKNGRRFGIRQILESMEQSGKYKNLTIKKGALCKQLIFDEKKTNKVVGVEYCTGSKIYRASSAGMGVSEIAKSTINQSSLIAKAKYEVIVAGGAFNSPQLLMLSGIGDSEHLTAMGIPTRVNLPGVGRNLQDRYEVTVISELQKSIGAIEDCKWLQPGDKCVTEWMNDPKGHVYSTNGALISNLIRSNPQQEAPDLNVFGLPGYFKGYYPNWSVKAYQSPNYFSWAVLKGHTKNVSGYVKLKSKDFQETPEINFNYFNSKDDPNGEDMKATVAGLKRARAINANVGNDVIKQEVYPGNKVRTDAEMEDFIYKESWGHHASCSNKIGASNDPMAVLDSEFRVRKVEGLRVVDASAYPKIPGLFIALPTMIMSEKAANLLIKKYKKA